MDKNLQRNERAHRKLVRSSEQQTWFGDNVVESGNVPGGGETAVGSKSDVHHRRSGSIGHDNKTIRRLEFFTSLQKQLMSSIGRRSGGSSSNSGDASTSSSTCNVKRNASCRHHKTTEKLRDKSEQKQTMPSSYSSASLTCCNNSTTSPVEQFPTTFSPTYANISKKIELKSDQKSNNSVKIGNHLSPTASIASAIITDHQSSAQPITINSKIGGSGGSPVSETHLSHDIINPITTISDQNITKNETSLSKSMPNTLMLSPTNPFFSSLEQHLIDNHHHAHHHTSSSSHQRPTENTTANSSIDEKSSVTTTNNYSSSTDEEQKLPLVNRKYNKNPFLYEINNGTTVTDTEDFDTSTNINSNNDISSSNNNDNNKDSSSVSNNNENKNSCNFQIGYVFPSGPCTKREEFLRATMKICLVVSPPSNKFQVRCLHLHSFFFFYHKKKKKNKSS